MFDVCMMLHVQKHLFLSRPLKCVVYILNPYEIFFSVLLRSSAHVKALGNATHPDTDE